MPREPEEQPEIRRGRGLRLSTQTPQASVHPEVTAEPTHPQPEPPDPAASPTDATPPVTRGRGLRLSTQGIPEPAVARPTPQPDLAERAASPTEVARWRISTATGPTSYLAGGAGRPLLLLHGWGASARIWAETMAVLADRRFCYTLDLPGAGETPVRPATPTLANLAADVLAAADTLGLTEFDLLGHSLGAAVAAWIAGNRPARVGRVALAGLAARPFAPDLCAIELARPTFDLSIGLARPVLDLWRPVNRRVFQSPPLAATIGSMMLHTQAERPDAWQTYLADHAAADARAYVTSLTAVGDLRLHDALRAIKAPTLCLAAREDRVARLAETTTACELIPGSQLTVLDNCGHLMMLERPGPFHAAVRAFFAE